MDQLMGAVGIFVLIFILISYRKRWSWTGFVSYKKPNEEGFERGKTLWDWMGLIIIPAALFLGANFFSQAADVRDEARERERFREEASQSYFNEIATLILKENLLSDDVPGEAPVRKIAQLRTVTTLRRMTDEDGTDAARIEEILIFLGDSNLLQGSRGVLASATMPGITLPRVNLSANFSLVNLNRIHPGQIIGGQTFNLDPENIPEALHHLLEVEDLRPNLMGANLFGANFNGGNLSGASLNGANLSEANLNDAELMYADLTGANLSDAKLEGTDLRGAKLEGTDLKCANLLGAIFSETVILNSDTILPDGTRGHSAFDMRRFSMEDHPDGYIPLPSDCNS